MQFIRRTPINHISPATSGLGTTSPQSKLQISGREVQVGSSGLSCTSNNAGAISYSSGALNYCNGSNWTAVGGGGGVTTFSAGTTGFTPNSATSGAVTLAGTLNIANGGTGSGTAAAYSLFGNNTGSTAAPAYQTAPILSGAIETLQAIGATSTNGIMLYDTTAARRASNNGRRGCISKVKAGRRTARRQVRVSI